MSFHIPRFRSPGPRPNRFDPQEHRAEGFAAAVGWLEQHGYQDAADALRGERAKDEVPIEWFAQVRWLWAAQLAIVRRVQRRLTPRRREAWRPLSDHFSARDPLCAARFAMAAERALLSFTACRLLADDFTDYVKMMCKLFAAWEERILYELDWLATTKEVSEHNASWLRSQSGRDCIRWAEGARDLARETLTPFELRGPEWIID